MPLPLAPPIDPMLAKPADALPQGEGWCYEPKWDGFRVLLFRDGPDWQLQSRDKKRLERYFPELAAPVATLPPRCVLDGEVVIARAGRLDFEALSDRIHPADSRIDELSQKTPAAVVFWDALCLGDDDLMAQPFGERRARLEQALAAVAPPLYLTPLTVDAAVAADWFARFEGAGLDGVMAKRVEDAYQPKKRAMLKVKHRRTADCVLAGLRWHKTGPGELVGSLLLGLHDRAGRLHHVGVAASFTAKRRRELAEELAPLRDGAEDDHPWLAPDPDLRVPGAENRWSRGKQRDWEPLRPERVVEVSYDHMEGMRFRHTAHFARWRPDKAPRDCSYDQLEVTPPYELARIFGAGDAPA
ncbi:ATP-dependent DNA ligase [Haliangium sp.]|uniref:ATP-dependent DNA ligase n=1 Tax=Haliangium sp. TaxID=2663208 RepID=UPI003D0E66AF